jgi:hypothetical protein
MFCWPIIFMILNAYICPFMLGLENWYTIMNSNSCMLSWLYYHCIFSHFVRDTAIGKSISFERLNIYRACKCSFTINTINIGRNAQLNTYFISTPGRPPPNLKSLRGPCISLLARLFVLHATLPLPWVSEAFPRSKKIELAEIEHHLNTPSLLIVFFLRAW